MPKSLISIQDFSKEEILHILDVAAEFEKNREQSFLSGKVVACLFFEPSTRTRLSFEAAVNRLGARVIGFPDNRNTSQTKGETLEDTETAPTSIPPRHSSTCTRSRRRREGWKDWT